MPQATRKVSGNSVKFCLVAAGEADLCPRFGTTMEWDTVAGQAVLEAAGGRVEMLDGDRLRYGNGYRNANSSHAARRVEQRTLRCWETKRRGRDCRWMICRGAELPLAAPAGRDGGPHESCRPRHPLYSLSGFRVGLLVGLTGVGGGSLMTPLLILLFGIHPATAVGTDLLYAAITKSGGAIVPGRNSRSANTISSSSPSRSTGSTSN
jgi:hypothetical protein